MNIKIWDNHNKQWLEPIAIYFGTGKHIWQVVASRPGENPLEDGRYTITGDALSQIAIVGDVNYNTNLLPDSRLEEYEHLEHGISIGTLNYTEALKLELYIIQNDLTGYSRVKDGKAYPIDNNGNCELEYTQAPELVRRILEQKFNKMKGVE